MMWMSAEDVVEASLAALRRREVICIPGIGNRVAVTLTGIVPRVLVRRVAGMLGRRFRPTVAPGT
jgi:short-subunit dehydrogenase